MKTLALALLIPPAVCTAIGNKNVAFAAEAPAAGAASAAAQGPASARVNLLSAAGSTVKGSLTLTNEGTAVSIRGEITGHAPGKDHGFHVHAVGNCSLPDFASAGDHFNPTKDPHGGPNSAARHMGDMQNARADDNGRAMIDITVKGATLGDKDAGPGGILGKSLVVHAMPDDYKTQPSGGSGARVACGVITK
jgi:Cu-Zn family superoxide dismutase